MKYFVFSDVHSYYDELILALNNAGYDKTNPNHKMVFCGDAFDKGHQHAEMYQFLIDNLKSSKLIWIKGNHDVDISKAIKRKVSARCNKETCWSIASYLSDTPIDCDDEERVFSVLSNNKVDKLIDSLPDYFETEHYVFTHGFIPFERHKHSGNKYRDDWRGVPSNAWNANFIRCNNGAKCVMKYGIKIPDKTLVCGHAGSYNANIIMNTPEITWNDKRELSNLGNRLKHNIVKHPKTFGPMFKPCYGDGFIAIDATTASSGFVNVVVLED